MHSQEFSAAKKNLVPQKTSQRDGPDIPAVEQVAFHTLPSAPMRNVSRVKAFSSQRRVPQQTASSQDLAGVLIHSLLLQ